MARLSERPFEYDFCALVRLWQSCFPEQPRIGHSLSPAQDPVRFAQNPALDFAAATIEAVKRDDPDRPPVIYSRHFGLFGPNGPLPLCLTEYARERVLHHGDPTFVAFCNVFHHRLLSFFFRAWADAEKTVDFDRPSDQHWSHYLSSLIGLGMESLSGRDHVPDRAKFYFAGRLVQQNRNAEGLAAVVQEFFAAPTEVISFVGQWLAVPRGAECKLGDSPATGTLSAKSGTVIVGSRFWTCQLHFRLRMGPMPLEDYERLLPSGESFQRLRDWVRFYAGDHYFWDVQLVLARGEVPVTLIGRKGRLGWTTWLKTREFDHDPDDLVLRPVETPAGS